ncbi:hypothetical protein [Halomontanus rarus]|uniref:hypothetical protein n=1 Tax=Halomontanus rarus TaxID=3034020 RepID=UPI00307C1560
MSTNTESKRRTAINQLGGPRSTQMYLDTDRGEPVVLREKDGWSAPKRDYHDRTWVVDNPRNYISDGGEPLETISQRTKLERMDTDRYRALPDETVDQILETAHEKNIEWLKVNSPNIPHDDGGVNVYVDGEWLEHKRINDKSSITAKDDTFEPTIQVHVSYGEDRSLSVETGGETIPYSRSNNPVSLADGVVYQPADGSDGPTVELRLDTDCEDHNETSYEIGTVVA